MFSHIMVGANDVQEAKKFYDAVLGTMGYKPGVIDEKGRCFYMNKRGVFAITKPINGEPSSVGNGSTIGFQASDPETADAWYKAGLENGGVVCEDPPGIREGAIGKLYLAYLRDPSGNKVCALHNMR